MAGSFYSIGNAPECVLCSFMHTDGYGNFAAGIVSYSVNLRQTFAIFNTLNYYKLKH